MTWDAQGLAGPLGNPLNQRQREHGEKGLILPGKPRDLQVPRVTRCAKVKESRMSNDEDRYYLRLPGTCGPPG